LKRVSGIPALLGRLHLESSGDSALVRLRLVAGFRRLQQRHRFAVAGGLVCRIATTT